jgi:hypothetical protein
LDFSAPSSLLAPLSPKAHQLEAVAFHTLGPLFYDLHSTFDQSYTSLVQTQKTIHQVDFLLQKMVEMKNDHNTAAYAQLRSKLDLKSIHKILQVLEQECHHIAMDKRHASEYRQIWHGTLLIEDLFSISLFYGGEEKVSLGSSPPLITVSTTSTSQLQQLLATKNLVYFPLILTCSSIDSLLQKVNPFVADDSSDIDTHRLYSAPVPPSAATPPQKLLLLPFCALFELDLIHLFSPYLRHGPTSHFLPCLLIQDPVAP